MIKITKVDILGLIFPCSALHVMQFGLVHNIKFMLHIAIFTNGSKTTIQSAVESTTKRMLLTRYKFTSEIVGRINAVKI